MLHHLVDEYINNIRSLIAHWNKVESNETRAYQMKNPEINPSSQNNTRPQAHPQSQHTNPKGNKPKCPFCRYFHFHRDCTFLWTSV
ncbi:unnamed protein product [Hymenolepis diminuta]|uniref:Uncharacterized protein n=1 Tax=Hymenolepis diminuta TaxID=6216 RepID=A0A564XZT7_HYMDI|nr:unnamed protein product [Hymenolepis diminuta]